jgi:hypothetical protein
VGLIYKCGRKGRRNKLKKKNSSHTCPLQSAHQRTSMENYMRQVTRTMLSRDNDDDGRKIRARKQRTDIAKYFFENRINKHWYQLPVEELTTLPL